MTFRRLTIMFMLLACALVAGAYIGVKSAEAQAPDVDLGIAIELDVTQDAYLILTNYGTDAANGVVVVFHSPGFPDVNHAEPPVGTVANQPGDDTKVLWRIARLPGGSRYTYNFEPDTSSGVLPFMVQHLATVTSDPPEAEELQYNNKAEIWKVWTSFAPTGDYLAIADLGLQAAVNDSLPSAGGTVEFTVTIEAVVTDHVGADVEVIVTLTEGLTPSSSSISRSDGATPTSTWTYDAGTGRGAWDIGVWTFDDVDAGLGSRELVLTAQVSSTSVVNEQCFTATLSTTPQEAGSDDNLLSDNSEEICLGERPAGSLPVLFQEGQTDLITLYDCVGNATYPCDSNDSLEWVTLGGTAAREAGLPYRIFQPGDVVVHVPDTPGLGRYFDSNDMPVWSTGYWHVIGNEVAFFREGVIYRDNFRLLDDTVWGVEPICPDGYPPFVCQQIALDREVNFTATISGPDPRTAKSRRAGGHHDEESVEAVRYDFDSTTGIHTDTRIIGGRAPAYFEFGMLGTYTVEVTATAKYNNNTPDDDTDDADYTTTAATYTFHVGPVADLEVRGLEESSLATAEQLAYTIEAVNHGPDDAEGAKVKVDVTLPEDVSVESSVASAGTYNNGVWNIGPLQRADRRRAAGLPEGETLTLIVTCDPTCEGVTLEDATATISNDNDAHPYTVCIGSDGYDVLPKPANSAACTGTSGNTWHSGDVYDHRPGNSMMIMVAAEQGAAGVPTVLFMETTNTVAPGDTVMTPLTDPATNEVRPVQVEVDVPAVTTGGNDGVEITVSELTERDDGSTAFEFDVETMHTGTAADPLVLRFHITTDADRDMVQVYYEGSLVPDCTAPGTAEPDPCVAERQRVNDVVTVRVLTTNASVWRVVVPPIETRTETRIEYRDQEVVTRTETVYETVYESENHYAYFADEETTRTVAENSVPGSPVGAPVSVIRNSGNKVAYSLEGPDAALFAIEQDTGQILVGEGALLDYESGTASYTVEVVADPRSGADVRTTVTITVTDVAETGFVFIDPAGAPLVGAPLFAGLLHTEGEPVEPRWQWQRSMPDGSWADIPGAILETYIPSDLDAGRRLRALVVFGNPQGDGEGLEGAVTERVPGEAQVIPTAGTGTAPEEVFGVLGHSLAVVWQFDNATQTWAVYSPWNAPELNDLKTVSRGDVVWMDIISEAQFQGNTLYPGWNLVILN